MNRVLAVAMAIILLLSTAALFAADWPQYLGPNRNGIAPDTGINKNWNQNPPQKLWQVAMHDGGYSGPSVADGKVFLHDHQGNKDIIQALNINNGQVLWRYSYSDSATSSHGSTRSTPVYDEGRLYTISKTANVHCLNADNGSVIWSMNMRSKFNGKSPKWGYAASAYIDGNTLILCPGGSSAPVVALNKKTGATLWTGGASGMAGYATPVRAQLQGMEQYVIFTADKLTGIRTTDGRVMWSYPWPTNHGVNAATPIVGGNYIFITSDYGVGCGLIQVTNNGAEAVWTGKDLQSHFNPPVFYNSYVFGIGNPGFMVCINSRTGKTLWKKRGFERGGLIAVDGVLIALDGKNGDCVMVEATPNGYNELGRFKPLGGQSWTAPIITNGKMIIRNTSALCCLNLK